ncbi:protein STRUBBELIG-RECEPTOR FAMILY 8 [Ananas comosus]|uniref:Protein STRUBBELIG-RECEPTOR FAMILY 8 n=1 Tax=Ananas comosus TaxID=4615 RepID=A0A6P5G4P9_ANACO|nr:protein STRUBBELIG-RECEPTOR FAMILY 8 [Ananas comosus]
MATLPAAHALILLLLLLLAAPAAESATDSSDAQALTVLYSSLNSPPQLSGWTSNGGDPCGGGSWKGISCSGSAVTAINLAGLGLNGTLGYLLSNLLSLKTLDISSNGIHDTIPYQLPPNLTYMNLANNKFSGNLPYSISKMFSLNYLNISHNTLSQSIGDIFSNLTSLSQLDLSFNSLTGDLPNSMGSLSNLSSLYLQDNQLTGSVNVLANLSLNTLNIANNNFSGWIPQEFKSIPNLVIEGNSFTNNPAPPPPPFVPSPPGIPHNDRNSTQQPTNTPQSSSGQSPALEHEDTKQGLTAGSVTGIVVGSVFGALCVLLVIVFGLFSVHKKRNGVRNDANDSSASVASLSVRTYGATSKEAQVERLHGASMTSLKPPPAEKIVADRVDTKHGSGRRPRSPITATSYTVASLQIATNSFSQDCLVGEGSLGRVYRAEFPNGKVLAVKKIDSAALSLQEEDNFLEVVSNISRLRHQNIVSLVGYCVEHGQRLLIYDYTGNGTLHDMLHFGDDGSKNLTWNTRVKIALGTARALEYLHEVCLPSVVHKNFKSANILLDEELNPRLSDCGLAALTPNTERQVSAEIVGSFGYSSPEFAMSGVYTIKSDVYSFGVVMLELLTGRKPLDSSRTRSEQSLVSWAIPQLHDIDALAKMVDPALNGMYPVKSLSRFADIIALCVQPEPEFRPPMSEVVQQLVRLMQRASIVRRRSGEELGYSYRLPDQEPSLADLSF